MRTLINLSGLAISTAIPTTVCAASILYNWHPGIAFNAGMLGMLIAIFGGWVSSQRVHFSPSHTEAGK